MGIEPFLIASTVRVVVGQRLVRLLNKSTRQSYTPTEEEKQAIIRMFNLSVGQNFHVIHELEKRALAEGVGADLPLSTDENGILTLWRTDPDDNDNDAHGGYKGRTGIYEVLANTLSIQKLIMSNATSNQIQTQAIADGMITMQTDGLIKALRGETTIEEVLRVSKD
jgi:type II secretory ATPase GspE/PulE/Tfp pilus assembly ATPase PilB-like protein